MRTNTHVSPAKNSRRTSASSWQDIKQTHERIFGNEATPITHKQRPTAIQKSSVFDMNIDDLQKKRSSDTFHSTVFQENGANKDIKLLQTKKRTNSPVEKIPRPYSKRPSLQNDHPREYLYHQDKENKTLPKTQHIEQEFKPVYREAKAHDLRMRDFHQDRIHVEEKKNVTQAQIMRQKNLSSSILEHMVEKSGLKLQTPIPVNNYTLIPPFVAPDELSDKSRASRISKKSRTSYSHSQTHSNAFQKPISSILKEDEQIPIINSKTRALFYEQEREQSPIINSVDLVKSSHRKSVRSNHGIQDDTKEIPQKQRSNHKDMYRHYQITNESPIPKAKGVQCESFDMKGVRDHFDPSEFKQEFRQRGFHVVECSKDYDKINNICKGTGSFMLRGSDNEGKSFKQHLEEIKSHLESQGIKIKPKQAKLGIQDIVPNMYIKKQQDELKMARGQYSEEKQHSKPPREVSRRITSKYSQYTNMEF